MDIKLVMFFIILIILLMLNYYFIKNRKKVKKKYRKSVLIIILLIDILLIGISTYLYNNNNKTDNNEPEEKIKIPSEGENKENPETTTTITSATTSSTTSTTKTTTTSTTTTKTTSKQNQNSNLSNKTSKGYTIEYRNGAYYINNVLIVNKTYKLTKDWKPVNPYKTVPSDGFDRNPLDKDAYEAWKLMKSDAASLGLNLWAQSGYRSYDYQNDLYNGYIKRNGKKAADTFSARPGASEHQTGLAFDLNTISNSFKDTAEGKWVAKNAYIYGYILRYPEGKTNETGYIYEPWHIRYVGKELAKELYNNGNWITMESYFGIDSKYND